MGAENNGCDKDTTKNSQENKPARTSSSKPKSTLVAAAVIVSALLVAGGILYFDGKDSVTKTAEQTSDPDRVLAVVNGDPVFQKDIDERLSEAEPVFAAQGVDISNPAVRAEIESQLVDDIINAKLLSKGAKGAGVTIEESAVDSEMGNYILQAGSEEAFNSQLGLISLTLETFRVRLSEQLVLQEYISRNIDTGTIGVSDEEITAFYDNVVSVQAGAPPLSEIRDQIEAQLIAEKEQQAAQNFINLLRENADITIN